MEGIAGELMDLFVKWYFPPQSKESSIKAFRRRRLICTPFEGNYGAVAGWVICVEGSPPKGTLVVLYGSFPVYIRVKQKRISGERQSEIIRLFCEEHLRRKSTTVIIEPGNMKAT